MPLDGGVDQIAIGVRENREAPAAIVRHGQPGPHILEDGPVRQRASESARLALGKHQPGLGRELLERDGEHLPVRQPRIRGLNLPLELVVASEQLIRPPHAEELLELGMDAPVPVDQRAVAVERRPALHAASLISAS